MTNTDEIHKYIEDNLDNSLRELSRLVAQPSIAAHNHGLVDCAVLVEGMFASRGFQTEILPTDGAPVVFADRKGREDCTLLFYNHYDVQPPEPIELWDSPPFEATRRGDKMYGRGISDNKGHIASRLLALDALLDIQEELPCNIKFVIEGEEEISSPHMDAFVRHHAEKLTADGCIWETGGVNHLEIPTQVLGMRGICYVEV